MAESEVSPPRYRFGPLQRRGLVAGWRGGQIGAVAAALVVGVGVLRASTSATGVVLATIALAVGVGFATWPIAGRTAEEWTPDALRHAGTLGRRWRPRASPFSHTRLIAVDLGARGAGVVHERSRRTFTAVLGASAPGFVLLDEKDRGRRVDAWAGVLASLARDGSAVHRVQWVERVVPAPEMVGSNRRPPAEEGGGCDGAHASYDALVTAESHASLRHQVLFGHGDDRGA